MESNDRLTADQPPRFLSEESTIASDQNRMPPYWHKDGDIILLVEEDDSTKREFRIHRLMLCLHSPVFRDMFSLGASLVKENEIPTVPVKGDSIKDVQELLKMLYKGYELYCGAETISFEGALGVLRLSHKYQMEHLKSCILKLLRRSWPNCPPYSVFFLSATQKGNRISKSIKLINAARETECHELLPAAFYELSNSNWGTWTSGVGDAESLCLGDWLRLMKGKALWMKRFKTLESAGLFKASEAYMWYTNRDSGEQISIFRTRSQFDACLVGSAQKGNVDYCLAVFKCLKSLIGRKILDGDAVVDGCKSWTPQTFRDETACEGCAKWMNSLIRNKEIEIWDNLIADFDLPKVDKDKYTKSSPILLF